MTTADGRLNPADPGPDTGYADESARSGHANADPTTAPDGETGTHATSGSAGAPPTPPRSAAGHDTEAGAHPASGSTQAPPADTGPDPRSEFVGDSKRVWVDEPNEELADIVPPLHDPTVVIEEGVVGKRLRRPLDLVRLLAAALVIVAIAGLAYFATNTTSSLGQDLTAASRRLPDLIVLILNVVGGLGLLTLPVAASVDMLVRGRGRQLLDALFALVLAVVVLSAAALLIEGYGSAQWQVALAGSTNPNDAPLLPLLGGLIAYITVARLMARSPWNIASGAVVVSLFVVTVITGGTTIAGIMISLIAGWLVGLAVRYALGTPTTRPSGVLVAATLARADHPVTVLRAQELTEDGRMYLGVQRSGPQLEVYVLDRDLEGAGLVQAAWRSLRLREYSGRRGFNMRRTLEQRALMSYAAQVGGVDARRLVVAREIGPDSTLLAYEHVAGEHFDTLPAEDLSDEALDNVWRAVGSLRKAGIAHRRLSANNIVLEADDRIVLLHLGAGTVAAGDVSLRIDLAETLCTLAMIVGPDRAIASGRRIMGRETLSKALPVLQPVALSAITKKLMRKRKQLMIDIRDQLAEMSPDAQVEHVELERVKPRTILMIVVGSIAVYVLLSQLAQVNLVDLFANAEWDWVALALVASIMTYPGAAWSLTGFVPEKLKLHRTVAAQLSGDFATLVAPPTLGAVAINLRYLQKAGVHPALATASIGVSQVAAFVVHILLLLGFGVAAGTQQDFSFEPPRGAILAGAALIIVAIGLALLPPVRRAIWKRAGPLLKQVGPRLMTVAQRPWKIVEGVGGMLVLNLGYILCLAATVEAFGGDLGLSAIAVVYLTASVIGQAAPTPGGLGAVEAAMAAGLTAAGLDSGLAVSAVLMYRLITFWLPTVPGYFAFNWLQRNSYL